jgi:hypothetical protein
MSLVDEVVEFISNERERDGLIVEIDGKLRIKYEEPEVKPKQLGLFEE